MNPIKFIDDLFFSSFTSSPKLQTSLIPQIVIYHLLGATTVLGTDNIAESKTMFCFCGPSNVG